MNWNRNRESESGIVWKSKCEQVRTGTGTESGTETGTETGTEIGTDNQNLGLLYYTSETKNGSIQIGSIGLLQPRPELGRVQAEQN